MALMLVSCPCGHSGAIIRPAMPTRFECSVCGYKRQIAPDEGYAVAGRSDQKPRKRRGNGTAEAKPRHKTAADLSFAEVERMWLGARDVTIT